MTTTIVALNVIAAASIVAALAGVCRLGYLLASGRLDERAATVPLPAREPERELAQAA